MPAAEGTGFTNPDFAAFARACGAHGFTVREPAELLSTVATFLATEGPAILHVDHRPRRNPGDAAHQAGPGGALRDREGAGVGGGVRHTPAPYDTVPIRHVVVHLVMRTFVLHHSTPGSNSLMLMAQLPMNDGERLIIGRMFPVRPSSG